MSKKSHNERIQGQYFRWLISLRDGIYYADGRSNSIKLGRYSLDSKNRKEALNGLKQLDLVKAVEHGLAERSILHSNHQESLTIEQGRDLYIESVKGKKSVAGGSSKTPKRYRAVFDKFLPFCIKRHVTHSPQITKNVVLGYASWLEEEGYAYRTRYLEVTTIKQMIKLLVEEGHLPQTSLLKIKMPKASETDAYCYRPDEVAAILCHCQRNEELRWLYGVLATLTYTGMRISEVASLRWSDVDLDAPLIRLTDERHVATQRLKESARELKGKRSRSLPIHPDLLCILQETPIAKDSRIFHGPKGGRLKPDLVRRVLIRDVLKPLAKQFPRADNSKVGFSDGRVHSFRHYFCSVCANGRAPEQALMEWLGHRSSQMVKHYYHLHDEASQSAMQSIEFVPRNQPRTMGPQSSGESGRPQL